MNKVFCDTCDQLCVVEVVPSTYPNSASSYIAFRCACGYSIRWGAMDLTKRVISDYELVPVADIAKSLSYDEGRLLEQISRIDRLTHALEVIGGSPTNPTDPTELQARRDACEHAMLLFAARLPALDADLAKIGTEP